MAPRWRPGGAVSCGSPTTTSVFVTIRPTLPPCPVFSGYVDPQSFERVAHRVRRIAVRHLELDRAGVESIAVSTPYGGFTNGRPSRPCVKPPRPPNPPPGSGRRGRCRSGSGGRRCARLRASSTFRRSRLRSPATSGCFGGPAGRKPRPRPRPPPSPWTPSDRLRLPDRHPVLRLRFGFDLIEVGLRQRPRRHRRVVRLAIEDRRLRIERRARPVDAADRVADVDRSAGNCPLGQNGRNERRRLPAVALQVLERLSAAAPA